MRRVIAIAAAGASLAGCSSFSLDAFKPTPPTVEVQLESVPSGADAVTSLGPGCKTPCSVTVPVAEAGFSVAYTMDKFQPATVPVEVTHIPGDSGSPGATTIDPNPVFAQLEPVGPPPKAVPKTLKPKKPKPAKPKAVAPGAAKSPFPDSTRPTLPPLVTPR